MSRSPLQQVSLTPFWLELCLESGDKPKEHAFWLQVLWFCVFVTSLLSPSPPPLPPHSQHLLLLFLFETASNCSGDTAGPRRFCTAWTRATGGVLIGSPASDPRPLPSAGAGLCRVSVALSTASPRGTLPLLSLASRGWSGQYVTLDNRSGELHTCPGDRLQACVLKEVRTAQGQHFHLLFAFGWLFCLLLLVVLVLPQEYFRFVKVKIAIRDINDNAPRFPISQISVWVLQKMHL